jgi:hypothetical protein
MIIIEAALLLVSRISLTNLINFIIPFIWLTRELLQIIVYRIQFSIFLHVNDFFVISRILWWFQDFRIPQTLWLSWTYIHTWFWAWKDIFLEVILHLYGYRVDIFNEKTMWLYFCSHWKPTWDYFKSFNLKNNVNRNVLTISGWHAIFLNEYISVQDKWLFNTVLKFLFLERLTHYSARSSENKITHFRKRSDGSIDSSPVIFHVKTMIGQGERSRIFQVEFTIHERNFVHFPQGWVKHFSTCMFTMSQIIKTHLELHQFSRRCVTHNLTDDQRKWKYGISKELLNVLRNDEFARFSHIAKGNEL